MYIWLAIVLGLSAGSALAIQGPLMSMIGEKLGALESIFIVFFGGALLSAIPLIFYKGGNLDLWRTLPWYVLLCGGLGTLSVVAICFGIPKIGAGAIFTLIVVAQLITGVLLDHIGFFGVEVRSINFTKIAGIFTLICGTWLIVK